MCQVGLGEGGAGEEGGVGGGGLGVGDGDAGDFGEGFLGEEGLMGGDEDVGEGEEAGEFVVVEDLAGEVLEEDAFFFLINVEGDAADLAAFEGVDEGGGVDEGASADVDEDDAGLHHLKRFLADDVVGFGGERGVEGDDVTLPGEGDGVGVLDAVLSGPFEVGKGVVGEDAHAESAEDLTGDLAGASGANEACGFAVEVEADEAVEGEVQIADAIVGAGDFAIEGEQEGDGVFGDGVG